ncbi:hypothetical protein [Roseococcus thiosulfatophilus]|uniref:hypothetical protein n=1 Tax=Roseococcus thiosulfatophilus TaxID=35813 RepID=UPI001A8C441A|nr:hypothetical protein [Roseococcus thiosulfatophilus]
MSSVDLRGLEYVLGAAAAQAGKAAHLARGLVLLRELPSDRRLTCTVQLPAPGGQQVFALLPVTVEEIRARLRAEIEAGFVDALVGLDQARDRVDEARGLLRHAEDAA